MPHMNKIPSRTCIKREVRVSLDAFNASKELNVLVESGLQNVYLSTTLFDSGFRVLSERYYGSLFFGSEPSKKTLIASFCRGSNELKAIGRELPDECFRLNGESMICISKVEWSEISHNQKENGASRLKIRGEMWLEYRRCRCVGFRFGSDDREVESLVGGLSLPREKGGRSVVFAGNCHGSSSDKDK